MANRINPYYTGGIKQRFQDDSVIDEHEMVKGLAKFSKTSVKQVMKSRIDISAISYDLSFQEVVEFLNKSGFSRIPVFKGNIDNIEGILYIKDLFPYVRRETNFEWQKIIRPGYFVPETKKIDELLKEFQQKRLHMGVVVDEYGGTAGIITLEDILEEIVGEIADELDEELPLYIKLNDQQWMFESKTPLNDFCRIFDVDPSLFEKVKGETESLGGLMLRLSNGLPSPGDKIMFDKFVFIVEAVNDKTIEKVKVSLNQEDEVQESAEE